MVPIFQMRKRWLQKLSHLPAQLARGRAGTGSRQAGSGGHTQHYTLGWAGSGRGGWAVGEMVDWECGKVSMLFRVHT